MIIYDIRPPRAKAATGGQKKKINKQTLKKALALFTILFLVLQFFTGLEFLFPKQAKAAGTTYYVDNCVVTGNDNNNGTDPTTPWLTISKVNATNTFVAGDSILFRKGCTWREQLTVPNSGDATANITFGAYGTTGAKPIISGADIVSGFSVSWQTVYSAAVGGSAYNVNSKANFRSSIPTANLIGSGTKIRITYLASNVQNSTINAASFGLRSGTTEDYATAPTAITFDGGSASVTIPVGTSKVSDEITFILDQSLSYLHHEFQNILSISSASLSGQTRYNKYSTTEIDESATVDIFGYTETATKAILISLIEAQNTRFYQAALTTEPQQVFFAGVKGYKRTSVANCIGNRDWYWASNVLYVYTDTDPATITITASTLNPVIDTNTKDYLTIQNLEIKESNGPGILVNASGNVTIQNNSIHDNYTYGISLANTGSAVTGNVIQHNSIYDNISHGVYFGANTNTMNSISVNYNLIYRNGGSGIRVDNSQTSNVIYNNTIDMNLASGISFVAASGFTVKNNLIQRNITNELTASATSNITHSNNIYWRSNGNLVSYNGSSYTSANITTFEATALSSSPLGMETVFTTTSNGVDIYNGNIYAGNSNLVQKSTDNGLTWSTLKTFASGVVESFVRVTSNGYIYVSPSKSDLAADQRGLWRSVDDGANWTRVIDLSAINNAVNIWGFDEDSTGRLFAGVYSLTDNAPTIYRSTDNGANWTAVYTLSPGKHIHQIKVDQSNNYVYATVGDAATTIKIIRSTDNGDNWSGILTGINQEVPIIVTPTSRIFGTDSYNGRIFRTTDDSTYTQVFSLANQYWIYWGERDSITGYLYLSVVPDATFTSVGIYRSIDDGISWKLFRAFPSSVAYDGSTRTSKIVNSKIAINNFNADTIQNGILMDLSKFDSYIPSATSPARDAGTNLSLTTDYAGISVPRNTAPEIGAYEYPVPVAPTIGAPSAQTSSTIRWNFADTSNDETGFRIYDNLGAIATSSATAGLSYLDETGLSINTQYTGRYVIAYNTYGNSASSSIAVSKYTLADTPTNLSGTAGLTTMDLSVDSFTNSTAGSSGYYFSRSGANSGWITTNSWSDSGLSCGNSYTYSVIYHNGDGTETTPATLAKSTNSCPGGGMPPEWNNPPKAPAGGFGISINSGAELTAIPTVILNLKGGSDTARMAISNFSDFRDAGQENYTTSKVWNLCWKNSILQTPSTCPAGTYTVYVKFFAPWGTNSGVVSDTVVLKTGVPSTSSGQAPSTGSAPSAGSSQASSPTPPTQIETNLPSPQNQSLAPFTKYLSFLQQDVDVKRLQVFLNQYPDTRLTNSGPGALGKETNLFGWLTLKAVIKFQEKYAQDILAPWKLTKGTGFVGRTTLSKINELLGF